MTLFAALRIEKLRTVAVYEPPISVNGSSPTSWFPPYLDEIENDNSAAALVTALKGMRLAPAFFRWLPRFVLIPLLK